MEGEISFVPQRLGLLLKSLSKNWICQSNLRFPTHTLIGFIDVDDIGIHADIDLPDADLACGCNDDFCSLKERSSDCFAPCHREGNFAYSSFERDQTEHRQPHKAYREPGPLSKSCSYVALSQRSSETMSFIAINQPAEGEACPSWGTSPIDFRQRTQLPGSRPGYNNSIAPFGCFCIGSLVSGTMLGFALQDEGAFAEDMLIELPNICAPLCKPYHDLPNHSTLPAGVKLAYRYSRRKWQDGISEWYSSSNCLPGRSGDQRSRYREFFMLANQRVMETLEKLSKYCCNGRGQTIMG
ncbi:predicted protein [Histoplasma capsulatum H143]|uniref:Uncharacterized protein n=1 Tax=Ajellomyces capsulatus (strain H143) TaxID=544712 RepID=C6HPZ8_AJECH|nr:predicted protein [Histoplasma capsulatum H143]